MINLTPLFPNQIFLPVATTQLIAQVNTINSTRIISKDFSKKYRRPNTGFAPTGTGAATSQIDVLIGNNLTYQFPTFKDAQEYALEAAPQMVNNACYYIENNQVANGYYQLIVWSTI